MKSANKIENQKNIFVEMEEEVLDFWEKNDIFRKSVERDAPRGNYVFYDGPPFGTGEPHYGHILSSVTKDVIPRYWTMQGYRVERRWGWDCHGLPIENIIEQDMGISGKKEIEKVGVDKFNEAARAKVLQYAHLWGKMVRRIGRWVEFENSYKTMDLSYMESVWWAFAELWKKDLIYESRKVLLYCPRCETPISNFEVAMDNSYKDITEKSVIVKFKIKNVKAKLKVDGDVYILSWTTTPWTLPGNVVLAIGEDIEYVLVEILDSSDNATIKKGDNYIFSESFFNEKSTHPDGIAESNNSLQEDIYSFKCANSSDVFNTLKVKKKKKISGKDLVGLEYEPLFDIPALKSSGKKIYYVTKADFVSTKEGTGIVHIAVVYGEDDYNLGLKLDLPVVPALDEKGYFNETVLQFQGKYFLDANKLIIRDLERRGFLFEVQDYKHSYPHCYRCDTQLFYNAIPAWFLNVQKLKPRMLELNEKINWFPKYLKEGRFAQGIEQAPDWNISRNRYFATPIPIWKCDQCKELEVISNVADLQRKSGTEVNDIHNHKIDHLIWECKCGGKMKRISEVFDCWVESGSMPFAQMHYPFEHKEKFEKNFPAQFISEYISQTRAWFYVMHVISTALFDKNSFENVIANGVILNEKGEKMSKSKKNYPDPWKIINEFGVDSLRMYLMSSSVMQAENLFFNKREVRDIFRKNIMLLWNVYKFYEMYANQLSIANFQLSDVKNILDQWIIARLNQLIKEVTENMNNYNVVKASRPIEEFINDLSTWYIRRSRDRFKSEDKQNKQAALNTTGYVLINLAKLIAPVMPFIAENIWQKVSGNNFKNENKSVHLESFPVVGEIDEKIIKDMKAVREAVCLGLSARDLAAIKVRQPLSLLYLDIRDFNYMSEELSVLVKDEVNVKNIQPMPKELSTLINRERKIVEIKDGEFKGKYSQDEDGTNFVSLKINLTPELKQEGIKREFTRMINNLRKEAGMTIKDRIIIYWQSKDDNIKLTLNKFRAKIMEDTLSNEIKEGMDNCDIVKDVKIEGEEILLGLRLVK